MNLRWEYFLVSFERTICYKTLIKISGMGVHIVIVLYYTARPKVEVEIRQVIMWIINNFKMKRTFGILRKCLMIELVMDA